LTGRVDFCSLDLAHPVVNGSGTFDAIAARRVFGEALIEQFPFSAFISKTITLEPRDGNPTPRLWEAPAGMINSIGLPNKGLRGYLEHDLPELARLPVPLITNVMGRLVRTVRPLTAKPLIVKLTPNTADVAAVAQAAEEAGADAVSLINTLRAMALHPDGSGEAWLGAGTGGLSGPAVRAVALAQVAAVARRVTVPIVGMGGVQTAAHAREMLDAGATLVGIGTESFRDPGVGARVAAQLAEKPAKSGKPVL
jgi:dihydroorotate dehydrogenase (NAD+) catalytic subunit